MGRIVDENYEPVYNDALVEETNEIIYKQVYLADNAFDIIPVQRVVRCKDCKHYKQSAVADRKMCFRKDVDGMEVCYDFLPDDSCTYGERKDEVGE